MNPELTRVLDDVSTFWGGRVGTHHASCYVTHAACLAALVRELLVER